MLEFNAWFFVLLAQFIVLIVVLNSLLFKPLAQIFKEREKATKGALEEAKALTGKKDEAIASMNSALVEARTKAKSAQNALREEGLSQQKSSVSSAEGEAGKLIEAARAELRNEGVKARTALQADVDRFAEEIVRKLVKI